MTANSTQTTNDIPTIQKIIAVLWPAFLVASVETIIFFTFFDPSYVFYEYDVTRTGAYSIGFFLFWGFSTIPSLLTLYFARPCKPCAGYKDEIKSNEN